MAGGQMGCDYQFELTPWVRGLEGAVSGMNLRGNTNLGLPLGGPSDIATMTAKTDFLPSVTAFSGGRFRHGTRLLRWRPDKLPQQCTLDQIAQKSAKLLALLDRI
jgi:hypothetical protein